VPVSITSGGVWKPKLEFAISALVIPTWGVELDGETVRGHCEADLEKIKYQKRASLLTDFLNWPQDPNAILKFTKKFGPIVVQRRMPSAKEGYLIHKGLPTWQLWPGASWTFSLRDWRELQLGLRNEWESRANSSQEDAHRVWLWHEDILRFHKTANQISLQVANPARFLSISLNALPSERMKTCKRSMSEGCPTPYFVATHLRQEYCSTECAAWAQRATKRAWWNQRQKRLKGRKHESL